MKSLKTIIIAGAVLIVFIIASLVVTHLPEGSGDTTAQSVSAEETSSSDESAYIINRDYDSLERFTIVPTERKVDENTSYAYASEELDVKISRSTDDKGSEVYSYDVSPDPGKFEYDTSMFRSMLYTLTSITANSVVEEDAKDLSIYGLDEPTATVKTYYSDGSEVDLIIGSQAPVDQTYYCMTSESGTVFTIGSYVDSLLVRRPIEYRAITLFPTYTEDDIYTNINWVKLTNRDGSEIEIQLDSDQSNEFNTEGSQYVMLEPYQVSGNASTIQQNILDVVATLSLGSIIKDISEEEYAEYGLDHPAKLEMTDTSGNEVRLLIGDTCPNADYTYCMLEGTDTLLTCSSSAVAWEGVSYVQFMLRTVWSYSIEQLKSLNMNIDGTDYTVDVTHSTKKNANGNDADQVNGTLDGEEISETNIRRLYIKCLYFRVVDNLTEDEKKEYADAKATSSITIELEGGETHVLELVPMTDRKYAMRLDGEMEYYCYKKNLASLETAIEYVKSGDELDFNFD